MRKSLPQKANPEQNVCKAQKLMLAKELVDLGMRTKIIASMCELPKWVIRKVCKQTGSVQTQTGKEPVGYTWFLSVDERMVHASILCNLYLSAKMTDKSIVDSAHYFIDVYRDYTIYISDLVFDEANVVNINLFWYLVGFIQKGVFVRRSCTKCERQYVDNNESYEHCCHNCRSIRPYVHHEPIAAGQRAPRRRTS